MRRIDNDDFSFKKLHVEPSYIIGKFVKNEEDMQRVENMVRFKKMLFISYKRRSLSWRTAVKRVGVDEFISGISRATFHATATRGKGVNEVHFACNWWM